jgi:S1-C subfamily serine protease
LTNAHVIGTGVVGTYYLFFNNGSRVDAKVLYCDPWLDYAFLQVDPKSMPQDATEIKFSIKDPSIDQPIFIIGNNEGKSFSIHEGTVTGLYEITGLMPQHSIRLSLNTQGGSSGSPVMNQQGEAIALNYGGSETYGLGLHPAYIRYALSFIEKGIIPVRKHIGLITEIYSLNEAAKYRGFPLEQVQAYTKKFPLSLGNAIQVTRTMVNTPANGRLVVGDIIWAIDGQELGPNLVDLDLVLNKATQTTVRLTVYRNGNFQDINVPLYNLEDHQIKQLISFGGAVFFESDDFFSDKAGIPAKTLSLALIQASSTFDKVVPYYATEGGRGLAIQVIAFDQVPVLSLEQLIQAIPKFIQQKYFTINYISDMPNYAGFGDWYMLGRRYYKVDVAYDENAPEPKIFTFNQQKMEWESKVVITK